MKVKFEREWRCWKRGTIAVLDDGISDVLIHRGICIRVGCEPVETACMVPPETATPRRRGRPRKYPVTHGN